VWLVQNYREDSCIALFRFHHSFADGYSLSKLIFKIIGGAIVKTPAPTYISSTKTNVQKICKLLTFPFLTMYEAVDEFTNTRDVNELHSDDKKTSGNRYTAFCETISVLWIKEIMKVHSVSFNSVICAAITGGLRNYMLENKMKIPQTCHAVSPMPYPGHPDTLVNHFTFNYSKFPLAIEDPIQRLKACNVFNDNFRKSFLGFSHFHTMKILGGVFNVMVTFLTDRLAETTAFYSNFPLPAEMIYFLDRPLIDVVVSIGCINTHTGVGFASLSYNGNLRTIIIVDESTVPTMAATERMANLVSQEFSVLRKKKE